MKKINILMVGFVCISLPCFGSQSLLTKAGKSLRKQTENIFVEKTEEKRNLRTQLEQDKKTFVEQQIESDDVLRIQLEEVDAQIALLKVDVMEGETDERQSKKLTVLNELYQVLKDLQKIRAQIVTILEDHITLLTSYLDDSDFTKFKKEHKFKDYIVYYSFNDLQYLDKAIVDQEQRVALLGKQERNTHTELSHRKQSAGAAIQAYKQKQEERGKAIKDSHFDDDTKELIALLNLEEQLYKNKQKLDELRFKEIEYKAKYIETKKFIAEEQSRILKLELKRIKPSIRVTESELLAAKDTLAKKAQSHVRTQEVYRKKLNIILLERQDKEKSLATLCKRYNIQLGTDIDTWRMDIQNTVPSYVGICQIGALNSYVLLLDSKRTLLDVQGTLEDVKLQENRLHTSIKESFFKITAHKFVSQEASFQEIQRYEAPKSEAKANLSLFKAKMAEINDLLRGQKDVLDAIMALRQVIQKDQSKLFKNAAKEYFICLESTNHAEMAVRERIEALKRLNSVYGSIINAIDGMLRQINFIINELNSITIWYRPEYAISWEGIKQFIPDMEQFFSEVMVRVKAYNLHDFTQWLLLAYANPIDLALFGAKLGAIVLLLILAYFYLLPLYGFFVQVSTNSSGVMSIVMGLVAGILGFTYHHLFVIGFWILLCAFLWLQKLLSLYIVILFYVLSIPYLWYLTNRLIKYVTEFNEQHNFLLLNEDYQRRFVLVIGTLVYATLSITLLRQAFVVFMLATNNYKSELPNILLAINFIVLQIALIVLISKEQVLMLFPTRSDIGQWLYEQVDRYYGLLLLFIIAVIVMGNPYVGFGRLVLHVLRGLMFTGFLLAILLWLYSLCKSAVSHIFFTREGDLVRERFPHSKTWFGLFIIAFFLTIGFMGFVFAARIWGWPIDFKDVGTWLNEPLLKEVKPPISVASLLQLIGFIMTGFLVSYGLNHFVLGKIFDLLLVDMGVQYTVTCIARYLIVVAAIFLGFQKVGLGSLVLYLIGALVFGISWILKEPISDFVAYFIILVQRPVKIGDYIQVADEVVGVVRRITPRSVVLRRKNSTTIVVPNSYLINRAITNWNYVRKFIAFDDILVTIRYQDDPVLVKKLLQEAVESHPQVLKNPKPIVRLDDFYDNGYLFMVRGFVSEVYTLDQWDIASDVRIRIVELLQQQGIKIAIPVRAYINSSKGTLWAEAGSSDTAGTPE